MKLLTIDETADETGISRQRLCAAVKSGDLPYFPRGAKRNRMLKLDDVHAWIDRQTYGERQTLPENPTFPRP